MSRMIGLLVLSPLFVAAFVVRLALFLPFALLLFLPMLIMRPRLILQAPRMFRYMLLAKRSGWAGCGSRFGGGRLERVTEPVQL